eukprot:Pgem_evm1s14023
MSGDCSSCQKALNSAYVKLELNGTTTVKCIPCHEESGPRCFTCQITITGPFMKID